MAEKKVTRQLSIFINDKQVINSFSGISNEVRKTSHEIRNLNKNSETYDQDLQRLKGHLADVKKKQAEWKEEIDGTHQEMVDAKGAFSNLFTGLVSGNLHLAAAGFTSIRVAVMSTTKAMWAFIATPVGATIAALAGIALAAKQWYDYNKAVVEANRETAAITKLSGAALNSARVNAKALAETFDVEFKDVLETAKVLVNEFDITYTEALDRIQNGLIKGGAANDEFLQSMKEYPTFFAQAKFSVEEFQNLINTGIDVGIYQDKLPDAIKEFALSINEQTPAVKEALQNAFGEEFTSKLLGGVKDGTLSVKDALFQVSAEADRLGLNVQQNQQLTADLFRGAGEDAGGALKIFDAVNGSIENMHRPLTEAEQAVQDLTESEKALAEAQDQALNSEGFQVWSTNAKIFINDVIEGLYATIAVITNTSDELQAIAERTASNKIIKQNTDAAVAEYEGFIKKIEDANKTPLKGKALEEATNNYVSYMQESLKRALAEKDQLEADSIRAEIEAIQKAAGKRVEILNKYNLQEIKDRAAANKAKAAELKRIQEQERRDEERERAEMEKNRLAEIKRMAKAQLDAYVLSHTSKLDKEKLLTQELIDEEEVRITGIRDQKLKALMIEKETNDAVIALKRQQGIDLSANDIEYLNEKKRLELENLAEVDALKEQYNDAQKALRAEQLAADNELALAEANNAEEEARIREQQQYDESVKRYKQMLTDKKITDEEYDRFVIALNKKRDEADRIRRINKVADELNEMGKLADALVSMFGQSKAAAIATASINAGLAVTEILKTPSVFPEPLASISRAVQIAGVVAKTGKAISQIQSQKAPKRAKFFFGGHTGTAAIDRDEFGAITGVVHKNEWVAPEAMTQSPRYANVIGWLEKERQKLPGYYQGGPTSAGATAPVLSVNDAPAQNDRLEQLIAAMIHRLENPVPPKLAFGYQDVTELNKMNDELTSSTKNGILNS